MTATEVRLGAADIESLRQTLETESTSLKQEINELLSSEGGGAHASVVDAVRDRGEESVADLYSDLGLARIERQVERLRGVESALYRIKQGEYGDCVECAGVISPGRLRADPAVARCIGCQSRAEDTRSAKDPTPSL